MRWNHTITLSALVCTALLLLGHPARAQAAPGDGIEAENLRLNLELDLATQANTNLFYADSEIRDQSELAYSLVAAPSLRLETLNPDAVALNLNWGASWTQYLNSSNLIRSQSGFATTLGGSLHFFQNGNVSLRIEEALNRTNEAPNTAFTESLNRFNNRLGAIIGIHPGARVLQGYLSGHWDTSNYTLEGTNLDSLNNDQFQFQARTVWRFLPRTALSLNADYRLIRYDRSLRDAGPTQFPNLNSNPLRLTLGLNGLLFNRFALQLTGGYAWAFYEGDDSDDFRGIIGRTGLTYYLDAQRNASLTAAYQRSFTDSTLGSFYTSHIGSLSYAQGFFNQKFNIDLASQLEFREYRLQEQEDVPVFGGSVDVPPDLNDVLLNIRLQTSYNPLQWLSLNASYMLQANLIDDNAILVTSAGGFELPGRDFLRNIFSVSVTARY